MEKQLKDYLYLYLGCKVVEALHNNKCILKEVHTDGNCYVVGDFMFSDLVQPNYIKPILRPLSDMTEQDFINVARLAYGEDAKDFQFDSVFKHKDATIVQFTLGNYVRFYTDKELIIENVDDYDDSNSYCHYDVHNWPEITRYLLSKHFDLFGLIEAGLAIDKSTL